jgi:gliding motility-associated-like protein
MKKLYSQFIPAFVSGNHIRTKAMKICLLTLLLCGIGNIGFAQVTVTPATGGTTICSSTAHTGGTAPAFTTLGNIVITETTNGDFALGSDQLILTAPAGWQFNVAGTPTATFPAGRDITLAGVTVTSSTILTITVNVATTTHSDVLTISGIQVQPSTPASAAGYIYASSVTGIAGITLGTTGTNFGNLAVIPAPISGPTQVCTGSSITLSDVTPGGSWTSSNATIATVGGTTGVVNGVGTTGGTPTITYTVAGCTTTYPIVVSPSPPAITGLHNLCAWGDTLTIHDAVITGTYNSTLITVLNAPGTGTQPVSPGNGFITTFAPGLASITYTLPSGCSVTQTISVNPLPDPITVPKDSVCVGSTITFADDIGPGTWSASPSAVGTIVAASGVLTGISMGWVDVTYTLVPTGCKAYDSAYVSPLPSPIHDLVDGLQLCALSIDTLLSAPVGGTWTSGATGFAIIDPSTGILTTVSSGIAPITYTLGTGCAVYAAFTVDALPGSITGPTQVCVGDSILLSDTPPGGVWTSGNTTIATIGSSSGEVTGITPGPVVMTYTIMPGGCTASYIVTVNPLPLPITGRTQFCSGDTLTAFDASPFPIGYDPWRSSDPITTAYIDPTGVVTAPVGGIPGVDTIYFTLPTGCFVSETITVDAVPEPITGTDSVCVGGSWPLFDLTGGGTWISGNLTVDTISVTGVYTGVGPGTAIDTYRVGNCAVTYAVTVYPVPAAIVGPGYVCQGQSVTLTDSTIGGIWTSADPADATVGSTTGIVTGINTATVDIIYTGRGGCAVNFNILVNALAPITGPTSVCVSDTIVLTDSIVDGVWSPRFPIVTLVGIDRESTFVIGDFPGNDTIYYTLASGCVATYPITVNPLAPIVGPFPQQVCVGSTISLTDAVGPGTWSTSDPTKGTIDGVGILTGIDSGVINVTYTVTATGCQAFYQVTINPLPGPILGDSLICQGSVETLIDTFAGGIWSVGTGTTTGTGVTIVDSSGVLYANFASIDSIFYTLPITMCKVNFEITVDSFANVIATGGTGQICLGGALSFIDSVPGGVWTTTNSITGSISTSVTGDSVTFTSLEAGVDTLYYTLTYGALTCPGYYPITVNPLPTPIFGDSVICTGDTATLYDTPYVGTWSSRTLTVASINNTTGLYTGTLTGTVAKADTITFTINGTGCLTTTVVTINPSPLPILGDSSVCLGFNIFLSDSTHLGVWSITPLTTATINPLTGEVGGVGVDTAVATYTLPTTCFVTQNIYVRPIPVDTVNHPGLICKGATDTITVTGAGPGGTYFWYPSTGLSATTGSTVYASPLVTTTYSVVGTSQYGCSDTSVFTVIIDSALNHLKIVGKDSICDGQTDTLMASGRVLTYFNWHPNSGISVAPSDTIVVRIDTTTTYTAVAIDDIGCRDSVSFKVTVNPLPLISVTPIPAIICRGTPLQLNATTANTDNSTTKFAWAPNILISCDTCNNPIVTDTVNLVYRVTAVSIYGCYDSNHVQVSVLDTNYNTVSNDTNICVGDSAQLIAFSHSTISNLDVPTYTWTPSNGLNNPYIYDPIANPGSTTTYTVAIRENACFTKDLEVTVFVQPYPIINLTTNALSQPVVAGTPTQLTALVTNTPVRSYVWTPDIALTCDTCYDPVATPPVNTTYKVTVTSIYGCTSEDSTAIGLTCDHSEVFIPNSFTPNGDGVNDRFYVSAKGISLIKNFYVFNRWGQLVFEAHNIPPNNAGYGWDGTFKGVVLEPDVFVYTVDAVCELGTTTFKYKGDISIVK